MERPEISRLPTLQDIEELPEWAMPLLFLGIVILIFILFSLGYGFRTVQSEATCSQQVSICRGIPTENGCIGLQTQETFYDLPQQCEQYDVITSACENSADGIPVQALDVFGKSCNEWSQAYDIDVPELNSS
ncbi:hypothetical protein ACK3SF_01225 [Candidatus Nanosalina sp. VS9-1]|uniref:hypothetical protein n=1 Tax=Candidatus Nanosalina sp. VS9-1 TaxID=3388566 RepID=UPI0039E1011E